MLFSFFALDSDCFPLVPYSFCQVSDDFSLLLPWILADYEEDLHLCFHGWKCLGLVSSVFFLALLLDVTFFLFCIHFLFAPIVLPSHLVAPQDSSINPREGPTRAYATASDVAANCSTATGMKLLSIHLSFRQKRSGLKNLRPCSVRFPTSPRTTFKGMAGAGTERLQPTWASPGRTL